jgi:hypothetical protein
MLTSDAENLLRQFPPDYRGKALGAVAEHKAFCPSCHFAGHMNCGYFDKCGAFIEPTGDVAR